MLLAQRRQYDFLEIYIALLDTYRTTTKTHQKELKSFFKRILREARALSQEEINYYEIDSDIYSVVSFLAKKEDFVKKINLNKAEFEFDELRKYLEEGSVSEF